MCPRSSSSYFDGSFFGFFFKISMILRPLNWHKEEFVNGTDYHEVLHLSWPTDSPEPSSLSQPLLCDCSSCSQSWSSSAVMLMSSLNSLLIVSLQGIEKTTATHSMTVSLSFTIFGSTTEKVLTCWAVFGSGIDIDSVYPCSYVWGMPYKIEWRWWRLVTSWLWTVDDLLIGDGCLYNYNLMVRIVMMVCLNIIIIHAS